MADPESSRPAAEPSAVDVIDDEDAAGRDRAATPVELVEQRLQVTSPRMWLALVGFVVLIVVGSGVGDPGPGGRPGDGDRGDAAQRGALRPLVAQRRDRPRDQSPQR